MKGALRAIGGFPKYLLFLFLEINYMTGPRTKDADWVRQSFLLTNTHGEVLLDDLDKDNRFFTSAALKFSDTTPGGSFAINPPPQFTRYADLKVGGRFSGSKGMGRYYSEAIDDNAQLIHLRFGVPQYNSLTQFFTGFYNTGAGQLARTGRSTSMFYSIGNAAGLVVSVLAWPIMAIHLLGVALRYAFDWNPSKFYYLKPTMPLYWNAVQSMVNHLAVNRGIIPRIMTKEADQLYGTETNNSFANSRLNELMPEIFRKDGGIDVYAMSRRAQRLWSKQQSLIEHLLSDSENDPASAIHQVMKTTLTDTRPDYKAYLDRWLLKTISQAKEAKDGKVEATNEGVQYEKAEGGIVKRVKAVIQEALDMAAAELNDGSQFITLRVNYTGAQNESFSNSTGESEISQKINSMSSSARSTRFNFADGNVSDGIVGKIIGKVGLAVGDFMTGMADSLEISGLAALGGAAFVDIPQHWQQSVANLPHSTYTIDLVSPYGNPISQLLNLDIPLCMLLAGALPLSTGKQSYTSPFLCQLFDQGRSQTRLGIIDSLNITRGTGNVGFSPEGRALAIQVSFSVKDLSSIMHMPISEGLSLNPIEGVFDEDNAYTDYLAVLAGMNLNDQVYQGRKLKLNLARKLSNFRSMMSWEHHATVLGGTLPARIASMFFKGTRR
jgi:hypothetical protein